MSKKENASGIEVEPGVKEFNKDKAMLWKRRYETSCAFYNQSDHKDRSEKIIKYLHNDFYGLTSKKTRVFLNQFFISLKTLIPMVVAHNPFVAVTAENDIVYEYTEDGEKILGPDGEPISHNISNVAPTLEGLMKKRLSKVVKFKHEMRKFLRDAIAINRGIFIVGHTANTEYSGAFNQPTFHAYLKSVSPLSVKRQAGTTRIDQGSYFFYEYELPVSHLKNNKIYNQSFIDKCTHEILEDIKIDNTEEYQKDSSAGYYDDVKYIKMRNAYDLITGEIFVFGKGCDEPLRRITPGYTFKNPANEFIPNELFQPEQKEPISDLMMGEAIVRNAHVILAKAVKHVQEFNSGYDIEKSAVVDKADKARIEKSIDRSFWVWENNAVSGGRIRQRTDIPLGPEPLNMVEYLFGYFEKMLKVYAFQQGGRAVGEEETATKTQAKRETSQEQSGDMSEMFSDACNEALEKYLEVLVKTTDTEEVVKVIGDAGEVEYRAFNGDEARRGQFYCNVDLQSMSKSNDVVRTQQRLKFLEIIKSDPDPAVQQKFNKIKIYEQVAKDFGLTNEGIVRKIPDTKGMDEQQFREYLKQQILKAKRETEQILDGAIPLPPTIDDDDELHLEYHLGEAQSLRSQAVTTPDPMLQQQLQLKIQRLVEHAQPHIDRKKEKDAIEGRMSGQHIPDAGQAAPQVPVSQKPPTLGSISGVAQRTGVLQ